jgi:uncharacterized membrane protein YdjX (TVP38/TMEM64 family)
VAAPRLTAAPDRRRPALVRTAVAFVVVVVLWLGGRQAAAFLPQFAAWVDTLGPLGPAVFIAGYAVGTVLLVPGSWLTLVAGAIFGLGGGVLYVMAGATLGATLAFLAARHVVRDLVARRLADDPRVAAVDRAVAAQGRRVVFLLRLSPLVPFNLLNYALGLSRVRLADYVVGSVGMLPGVLLYVYTGKVAGDLASVAAGVAPARGPAWYATLALGLAATIAVTVLVTRVARAALADAAAPDGVAPQPPTMSRRS